MNMWTHLWRGDTGQDLVDYALLVAFLALTTAALVIDPPPELNSIRLTGPAPLSLAASAVTSR